MGLVACQYRAAEWRHKEIELAAHDLLQHLGLARRDLEDEFVVHGHEHATAEPPCGDVGLDDGLDELWTDDVARTGCTVVLLPDEGRVTSVAVRGAELAKQPGRRRE